MTALIEEPTLDELLAEQEHQYRLHGADYHPHISDLTARERIARLSVVQPEGADYGAIGVNWYL